MTIFYIFTLLRRTTVLSTTNHNYFYSESLSDSNHSRRITAQLHFFTRKSGKFLLNYTVHNIAKWHNITSFYCVAILNNGHPNKGHSILLGTASACVHTCELTCTYAPRVISIHVEASTQEVTILL